MKPEIQALIDEIVRTQLGKDRINSVIVEDDLDFDGEPVLRVVVVLEERKAVDPAKATGLVRHMRSCLTQDGKFIFPMVAFRSLAEQKRLKAAAA